MVGEVKTQEMVYSNDELPWFCTTINVCTLFWIPYLLPCLENESDSDSDPNYGIHYRD